MKNSIKNYWVSGLLSLCLLSAFMPPLITMTVMSATVVVLLGRLVVKHAVN